MAQLNQPCEILFDVTLSRDGVSRRWTIDGGHFPNHWSCRLTHENAITVSACFSRELVAARLQNWQAQIQTARADGWA